MEKEAKLQYDFFLENDELKMFFPSMTGDWETDKSRFLKIWNKNRDIINNFDIC